MVHAVALLAISQGKEQESNDTVAKLWIGGTVLFSGSLYGLALGGPRILGPVTPLGGLCMMAGWGVAAMGN